MEGKVYKVIIATPAKERYQEEVLSYLSTNFSIKRALEIDEKILNTLFTLERNPERGRREDFLKENDHEFRHLLFKETRLFELKIIYFINQKKERVYVTDFFPTKMHPDKILKP